MVFNLCFVVIVGLTFDLLLALCRSFVIYNDFEWLAFTESPGIELKRQKSNETWCRTSM